MYVLYICGAFYMKEFSVKMINKCRLLIQVKEFTLIDINTNLSSYNQFVALYAQLSKIDFDAIKINVKDWFGANMSAVLGGILDKIALKNTVSVSSGNAKIISILQKNTFLANYGYKIIPDVNGTAIKYLKLKPTESRFFNSYIINELLSRSAFPSMTDELRKKIAESIYEIFVNAQIHSNTDYIYTCGQFFPKKHKIEFTIVDMGDGFKKLINGRFNATLTSVQAIKWAVQDGHTTKTDVSGGLGLSLLTEFIKLNNGKFQIISDDGFYEAGEFEKTHILNAPFPGTIVNMQFRTDDTHSYRLSSETYSTDDIF